MRASLFVVDRNQGSERLHPIAAREIRRSAAAEGCVG
jgi:hypothetical protein